MASQRSRDLRYAIAHEFCGYARQRHVVRFCGDWLGQAATRADARAIVANHAAARNAILEGATR